MNRLQKTALFSLLFSLPFGASALERINLLPPEAQTYLRISNTTNFWGKLTQSPVGKLWKDQLFQDFMGNPDIDSWQELLLNDENDVENQIMIEQLKMLGGEIIIGMDWNSEEPYIIAAITEADFKRSLDLDDKLKETAKEPFEIIKSSFLDVEIIQHIQNPGYANESKTWQAYIDNTLLLGQTREWVEEGIVRIRKDKIKEPEGNPALDFNLPLASVIRNTMLKEMKKSVDTNRPQATDPEVLFEALGILGIETLNVRVELQENQLVADGVIKIADLNKGVFTILDTEPSTLPTVTFIPDNIASIEVGRFNLLRFWQEIPNVLATSMPAVKPQFDLIVAMLAQQTGIDFEQDLLANLGTKYFSFNVAEGDTQNSVIAVELRDSAAFKTGLETAIAAPALQPQVTAFLDIQDFLEHTIYLLKNQDPENPMSFAAIDGYLIYGSPEGVRQVIRSVTSETAQNTRFEQTELVKGLRQHVPSGAYSFSAIDWKKNMKAIVRELTRPEYAAPILHSWATSGSPIPPPDFSKIPPADHIASFFNVSYQYLEAKPNGIHQKFILKY